MTIRTKKFALLVFLSLTACSQDYDPDNVAFTGTWPTTTRPSEVHALEASVAAIDGPITTLPPTTIYIPPTTVAPTTAPPTTEPPVEIIDAVVIERETSGSDDGVWYDLAQCESGGNWQINTGNGYYGGLQFSLSSWRAVGGSGYPHEASAGTQIEMGRRLQAAQGWGAWPGCARQLGLR